MNKELNNQQEQGQEEVVSQQATAEKVEAVGSVATEKVATEKVATDKSQNAEGRWEAVDADSLGFTISGDVNKPILGPDGAYYCISNAMPEYGSIQANQNNAVPTPASIVQLPPIVQPIALVPYASQNQPLLQYDPNYRPTEQQTEYSPKYRLKPYRGISFVQLLCCVAVIVCLALFAIIDGVSVAGEIIDWSAYRATGIDTVYGMLNLFGIYTAPSVYFDKILDVHFAGDLSAGFGADFLLSTIYLLVPIFVALIIIISIILLIVYLVKMGTMKSPRGFNVGALINLILSVLCAVLVMVMSKKEELEIVPGIILYVVAGISLFMIIFSYFAKKNAYIIDESALKRVYIFDENQR